MLTPRILQVKKLLKQNNIDATLISSLFNIAYLTDFYHFSDMEREVFLLITSKNNYIFTDGRYTQAVKKHVKNFQLCELTGEKSLTSHLLDIFKKENILFLGLEEDDLTVKEHKQISKLAKKRKHLDLKSLRINKTPDEIKKIKKACEVGDKAFSYILKHIKLDVTEKELASKLETFFRESDCIPSFPTIVAFQENAAVPHHKTSNKKLEKNNFVLLDFGVKFEEYCSDMTRTIFFGKATEEQKQAYQTVLVAQQKAIKQFDKEKIIKSQNIDRAARSYIISKGYPSIPHSLGHGIGLQVHESPRLAPQSKDILNDGMVFSIEPGIYLPNKFGIRIEDLFALMNNKLVQLTKSPSNLLEI